MTSYKLNYFGEMMCDMDTIVLRVTNDSIFRHYLVNVYIWGGERELTELHLDKVSAVHEDYLKGRARYMNEQQLIFDVIWGVGYNIGFVEYSRHLHTLINYLTRMLTILNRLQPSNPSRSKLLDENGDYNIYIRNQLGAAMVRDMGKCSIDFTAVISEEKRWKNRVQQFLNRLEEAQESQQTVGYMKNVCRVSAGGWDSLLGALLKISGQVHGEGQDLVGIGKAQWAEVMQFVANDRRNSIEHYMGGDIDFEGSIVQRKVVDWGDFELKVRGQFVPEISNANVGACFFAGLFPDTICYPLIASDFDKSFDVIGDAREVMAGQRSFKNFEVSPANRDVLERIYMEDVELMDLEPTLAGETQTRGLELAQPEFKFELYAKSTTNSALPWIVGAVAVVVYIFSNR